MLIEGLPLFFLELSIGQRMRKSAILCWRDIHPCLFGIGVCCLVVSLMLCLYYVVVISWCCYYFFISFTSELPWKKELLCHNWDAYNSILTAIKACETGTNPNCTANSTMLKALKHNESTFPDCCVRDPPQYYFYHHALQISTSIDDPGVGMNIKLLGCLVFAWVITYLCVVKGIKSSGKVRSAHVSHFNCRVCQHDRKGCKGQKQYIQIIMKNKIWSIFAGRLCTLQLHSPMSS